MLERTYVEYATLKPANGYFTLPPLEQSLSAWRLPSLHTGFKI